MGRGSRPPRSSSSTSSPGSSLCSRSGARRCGARSCRWRHRRSSRPSSARSSCNTRMRSRCAGASPSSCFRWSRCSPPAGAITDGRSCSSPSRVGLLSGLMGGAVQISGPPVILYWLGSASNALTVRANFICYFATFASGMLVTYSVEGPADGGSDRAGAADRAAADRLRSTPARGCSISRRSEPTAAWPSASSPSRG